MNRRSFLAHVVGWFTALFVGRSPRARPTTTPEGYRVLSEPYFFEPGVPIGMVALVEDPR